MKVELNRDELLEIMAWLTVGVSHYDDQGQHEFANRTDDLADKIRDYSREAKHVDIIKEESNFHMDDPILCYVEDNFAYFTSAPLDKQWGDDWNNSPWYMNAGTPYEPSWIDQERGHYWEVTKVAFEGDGETPGGGSVQMINNKAYPWLYFHSGHEPIFAGTTLSEFKAKMREVGNKIFVEEQQ